MPVKRKFPIVLTLLYHEAVQYTGKTFKEQQVFKVHVELNLSHGIYFYKSRGKNGTTESILVVYSMVLNVLVDKKIK